MKEQIIGILELILTAGVCTIFAILLKERKARVLTLVHDYIEKAENLVQGSGLGAEKKALVVAWLKASGETLTPWLDKKIDAIVKYLNDRSAWALDETKST